MQPGVLFSEARTPLGRPVLEDLCGRVAWQVILRRCRCLWEALCGMSPLPDRAFSQHPEEGQADGQDRAASLSTGSYR